MAQHVHKQTNGFNQAKCGFFQPLLQLCQTVFVVGVEKNVQRKAQADTPKSSARFSGHNSRFTQQGFGLLLLLTFLASSVLVASSLSLVLAPSVAKYMGSPMVSESSAQQIANYALDQAQSDILTQLGNGVTVSTSYRYPASGTNSVSIPTYPSSGANASVGTYYVTVTKARGLTYVLQANVSAGTSNISISRLVQLKASTSIFNSALAIYSLRKTRTAYSGYAAKVRCTTTSTTPDIGFSGAGDFDISSLRTCLGDSTLPLDVATGEKLAYGLRKLSSSYSGYAIKVRRSSDSTTQDIGFDTNGNLDTKSLKTFVGSGSGYVATWYDQSGNGKDVTQATAGLQPLIVNAGLVLTKNNVPSIYFDSNSLSNTTLAGTFITGSEIRAFLVSSTEAGGAEPDWGEFAVLWKSGTNDAWNNPYSMELLCMGGDPASTANTSNAGGSPAAGYTTGVLYQHTSYLDASTNIFLYRNGSLVSSDVSTANLAPTSVIIGTSAGNESATYIRGYISEIIVFNASVSAANRATIERSQGHYYNIAGMKDGFVTTWYDQSGNGRSATQATTSSQPIVRQAVLLASNGTMQPATEFDGSNDSLATAATTAWPSGTSARTMNTVHKLNSTASTSSVFGWGNTNADGNYSGMLQDPTAGFWGWNSDVKIATAADTTYAHRITITKSGSTVTVYRDGTSGASGTPTLNTASNTALIIGTSDSGFNYLNGDIAEITVFTTALSTSDRTLLETSQSNYYGQ